MTEQEIYQAKLSMFKSCVPSKYVPAVEQLESGVEKIIKEHRNRIEEVRDEYMQWWRKVIEGEVKYFRDDNTGKLYKVGSMAFTEPPPPDTTIICFVNHK